MEEKKMLVDYELCNFIEATQYDLEGIRQLLLSADMSSVPIETRDYWKDAYLTKFKEYNLAKQELEKAIKESGVIEDGKDFSWKLDFDTREVTITQ